MTLDAVLACLHRAPLVASAQASPGSPLADSETLLRLAQASLRNGAEVVRLQGIDTIARVKGATGAPIIGLIKRDYEGSPVYITPTVREIDELLATGCEVIALDGTLRPRPAGADFRELVARIHRAGRLAMADCDSVESAREAEAAGADLIGTTMAGYTEGTANLGPGPAFGVLREICRAVTAPVIAEGRYSEPREAAVAMRLGATAVVIGGALNDPVKQTRAFAASVAPAAGPVGAVDLGGTWIRFGVFSPGWQLVSLERTPRQEGPDERVAWIRAQAERHGVTRLGIGTGGTVDPRTGEVWEAKPIIPGHQGTVLSKETLGVPTLALNDGLATAWGHACLPMYAGLRVGTLALGTGVGCGAVLDHRLVVGARGMYPRLNDLPFEGSTVEEVVGGAALAGQGNEAAKRGAKFAAQALRSLFQLDRLVLCGGVGFAPWLELDDAELSPFGEDAGLFGAAALALFPPSGL